MLFTVEIKKKREKMYLAQIQIKTRPKPNTKNPLAHEFEQTHLFLDSESPPFNPQALLHQKGLKRPHILPAP